MGLKLSVTLAALAGLTALSTTTAQAGPRHWFYGQYGYYDQQAYYDDGYYDDYANPPRRYTPRELERFRAWAHRQNQLVRERRLQRRARNRARRQRLYDAWLRQGGEWRGQNYYGDLQPRRRARVKPRKRFKLAYVPIPREKPYHLLTRRAAPAQPASVQPPGKRQIRVSSLPPLSAPASAVTAPAKSTPSASKKPVTAKKTVAGKKATPTPVRIPITITTSAKPVRLAPVKPSRPVKVASVPAKRLKPVTGTPTGVKIVDRPQIQITKKLANVQPPKRVNKDVSVARSSKNPVSCTRAKSIVSEFGFGNVRAVTCRGKTYAFDAMRDGKPYNVKVSALSGELKDVTKLK